MDISIDYLEREQMLVGPSVGMGFGPSYGLPSPGPFHTSDVVFDNNYVARQTEEFEPAIEALAGQYAAKDGCEVMAYHDHSHTTWYNTIDKEMEHVHFKGEMDDFKGFIEDAKAAGYGTPENVKVNASVVDWLTHPVQTWRLKQAVSSYMEEVGSELKVTETEEDVGNRHIYKREITFESA